MKKKSTRILIGAMIIMMLIFAAVAAKVAKSTYDKKVASESFESPDFYSMQEYCSKNASEVMSALKSGKTEKIEKLMTNAEGLAEVAAFADWKKADFKNAVSMGAGSLRAKPDKKGRMDISERFFVDIGEEKYVLYVETLTSRYGLQNDGVSAIGVTTYKHFDDLNYAWNGEKDDNTALAGALFWDSKK